MGWVLVGEIEGNRVGIERGSRSEFPGGGWVGGKEAGLLGLAFQLSNWVDGSHSLTLKH